MKDRREGNGCGNEGGWGVRELVREREGGWVGECGCVYLVSRCDFYSHAQERGKGRKKLENLVSCEG